ASCLRRACPWPQVPSAARSRRPRPRARSENPREAAPSRAAPTRRQRKPPARAPPPSNRAQAARTPRARASDLLFDARGLAREITQVVQLGTPHVAVPLHDDVADRGAVGLEHALHALPMRNLAHGKRGVEPTVAPGDDDALVGLHALAVALGDLHLHYDGVTRLEVRDLARHALLFDFADQLAHVLTLAPIRPAQCAKREIHSAGRSPRPRARVAR